MTTNIDKSLLHAVIDDLPTNELDVVCGMLAAFINDYQDRHLNPEEYDAHMQALSADEWYD